MKRFMAAAALSVLLAVLSVQSYAKGDFFNLGIKAGLDFTNMSGLDDFKQSGFLKTYTGFNAGLVFNFNLPLGFELNPELLYVQSGIESSNALTSGRFVTGSMRVPVNVQWGISLFDFIKPYLVVSPYVGAVVFGQGSIVGVDFSSEKIGDSLNRFQYGIGVGAGIYVWKFQLSFKWNWDLNPVFKEQGGVEIGNNKKFNGGELSLAFMF